MDSNGNWEHVNLFEKLILVYEKKNIYPFGIIECLGMIKMKYSKDFIFIGVSIGKDINEWMGCSKIK